MRKSPVAICVALAAATLFTSVLLTACGGSSGSVTTSPPVPVVFPNVDVIVGSRNGGIVIIKDLANHALIGADVFIDNTGPTPIGNHGNLAYENDWLVASSRDYDNVLIWGGVSTLTTNQVPNAIVTTGGQNVRKPALAGGDLYVPAGDEVWIWRDITTVMSGDPADAVLTGFNRPCMCLVHNDVLYVSDRNDDTIYVYTGAAALIGGEPPSFQLASGGLSRRLHVDGDVLWAAGDSEPGGIGGWTGLAGLVADQGPDQYVFGLYKLTGRAGFWINGSRGYYGNRNDQDGFMLYRFDLNDTSRAAASVTSSESGLDRVYALSNAVDGILVGSDRNVNGIFYYPPLFGDGEAPSGWVFDTRLIDAKDIIVIPR